ncbi:leukocyte surface antigen CD53-like [Pelmatolapia mariae]|uniref:leukocyte surface antigen CD53-like n=1 Tax=Pelmatolapia mariae TaxID=158779 RepID=UPI002FE5EB39
MGKVNVCLKRSYIVVISVIAVISLVVLVFTPFLFSDHELKELVEELKKEYLRLLPLTESSKELLDDLQTDLECCGLQGYQDWKSNIPKSCLCAKESTNPCVETLGGIWEENQTVMVYEQMLSLVLCRAILRQLNRNRDTPVVN